MKARSPQPRTLTAAQRGQIVQRVIVDGWSTGAAAQAAGVPERLVVLWVADFRRHGMASLRHKPGKTVAREIALLRMLWSSGDFFRNIADIIRRLVGRHRLVAPSPIRHSHDDRRGSS